MKSKRIIIGTAILSLIGMLSGCKTDNTMRFGAAGLGGIYREFASSFAESIQNADDKYTVEIKTTAGSAANLRLLSEGYIQLAVAQNDMANDAYYGTGTFADKKQYQGYSAVAALYTEACQVVVRSDSGITSIDELQGKTVSIGEEESGTEQNAEQILSAYGLSDKLINKVNLDYTDAADKLKNKEIDAFFCTAGTQTTVIEELAKQCDIKLLSLDRKAISRLLDSYGFYTECTIPEETYSGQSEEIDTVGVKAVLLASNKLSDQTVENLTKTLFEDRQKIQYTLPVNILEDKEVVTEGITVPFHDGAAKYYESCGIEVKTGKGSK